MSAPAPAALVAAFAKAPRRQLRCGVCGDPQELQKLEHLAISVANQFLKREPVRAATASLATVPSVEN
eukprot:CAMPEP_0183371776 /NCGR_PEP_ID=MMETSP0164_2-20130417/106403_1 /TAXON_ID=221442 /ORGANISM="Coccolithus pelagicus ssp braarudi, Strain PLY182g" /LENGTH=67 /DNA_ID=CAMNT_0025548377 /DNA_START=302 /DNA_END=502 /DNA_ORIENTATION=-